MNPSDIFKSSLVSGAASALSPVGTGLYNLGKSVFGGNAASTPSTLQSAAQATPKSQFITNSIPTGPMSTNAPKGTTNLGGNSSATTPKAAYVNSQTGSTGSTVPSTAPVNSATGVNPNYAFQVPGGGSTPPGSSSGSSPSNTAYQDAFNAYIASLSPTGGETAAAKYLSDLQLQAQKDQEQALSTGETTGFASGEAARVNRNNQFGIDAASNALNALTGARTASNNSAKARLDFEKGIYDTNAANAKPNYTTVSPGSTVFDPATGKPVYTAPTTASQGATGGAYVAGQDPAVDSWVARINSGQNKITEVPANLKNSVIQGLNDSTSQANSLKSDALSSAQQLLQSFQGSSGLLGSKLAVGSSSFLPVIPGTQEADFVKNLDNLKSLLSLDNVKYLKGQGAVSDAERKLLADSATQLDRSQSEEQFQATLQKIIQTLGAAQGGGSSGGGNFSVAAGGQTFTFPDQASLDAFKKEAGI